MPQENIPEMRKQTVIAIAVKCEPTIDYERYSSLNKLMRVVSYILRFSYNTINKDKERKSEPVSVAEIRQAKLIIVRLIQAEELKDELKALKRDSKLPRSSRLTTLNLYLDENHVLRVEGRLAYLMLLEEAKHPIILPASHPFTRLVIVHYHEKLLHAGAQTTLNAIREEFWPIFARSKVKGIVHKCVNCRKAHPKPSSQLMGQLPLSQR